ncbi:hypothetical protein CY35_16G009200 [Sphagnum magellanicum]|nr:hypothetical protein CY35_16G009200 [Sphagnum magellanicum]
MNPSANTNEHQGDPGPNWSTENWDSPGVVGGTLEHASRQYPTNRLEWEWDPMILATQHPGSGSSNEAAVPGDAAHGDHKTQQITAGQISSLRAYSHMISPGLPANFSHNAATLGIFGPAGMQNRHHHHHAYGALDGSAGAAVLSAATGGGSHLHNSLQGSSGIPGLAATSGGLHVGDMQTAFEQQQQQRRDHYFASGIHEHHLVKREDVSDGHTAPRIGLNLGVRTYFSAEDTAVGRLAKRPCAGPPNTQVPMCQAEGCKADLSTAKHYHRRHKVCELHSKAPTVIAAGLTKRFCQQCSRFHLLAEFDEGKRSCRKRLADHNRRRRKPQPGAVSTTAAAAGTSAEIISIKTGTDSESSCAVNGASYGRGGGHGDSSHQSPHHHHGMQQQTTSSMKGPDPHQALLSAMSLSTSSVPLMLHNAKRQMSMMPGSSSSNHAHEAATAAYQHFLQGVTSSGQSGPHLSLSSLGGQLGLSQQQGSCQSRQATGNYNTSTRIEPGVPWLRPLNSHSDLMQQQEVVVGRSPPSLQQQQQQQHFQPPHHSTTLASANSPRSQNQKLQVYSPSNQNLIQMQSFSRGDLGSPEWMLGSRDERSKHYGPSSSAMSGSHTQLQQQGHQMLGLPDSTSTIHHHQAGDDSGLAPGGGGGGGTGQCGSSAQAAAAGGHAAPAMEFLQHGIIHPTTTESNITPDNNNNNSNNDEKNKKEKSPELKVYSHELEALRSYEAGSSIYDSHPLL